MCGQRTKEDNEHGYLLFVSIELVLRQRLQGSDETFNRDMEKAVDVE